MGFDWSRYQDGQRFKFVNPGDKVEGEIVRITATTFGGTGDPTPVLSIKKSDGTTVEVTASQTVLQRRLADFGPDEGDTISITYTGEDTENQKPGRSAAKLFDVVVKKGKAEATVAAGPAEDEKEPF